MVKKPKKKENPAFDYAFPELDDLVLPKDAVPRRKLKVMRYWCFRFMSEAEWTATKDEHPERYERITKQNKNAPKGLKKYVESLPGFGGWAKFGDSWDLRGGNPFFTVYRLMSLWTEWEHIMDRVAIPMDAPPEEILARVKALEQEYDEKRYDSTH